MAQRSRFPHDPAHAMHSAMGVTPSDTVDLPNVSRGIYVGGQAGNLRVNLADDTTAIQFTSLAVGIVHPLAVKRVFATGTSATGIIALY